MARRKTAAAADDGEEVPSKKMRKTNFTDADIRLLLSKYLEKKEIFQNEENSAFVIKSQEGEWERIVQALNAQNATLNRTWKEVRKKYYNLASEAKKLRTKQKAQMLMTGDYEDSLSPPPATPAPTTTAMPAVIPLHKTVDKKMLEEATYAALLSEKAEYDAEIDHLKEKMACEKLRRELLQIELFEKKRCFEEVRAEDLMKT
uniref:Regulatory protein zeste n=1 Tax=Plectus sambesii TaxID=2011161 RepID=A0A914V2P5_9BILA